MSENKNRKRASLIRAGLCVVVMAIVILGWLEIIPSNIGVVAASLILCAVSLWNGLEAFKSGRKGAGIFNIIIAVILVLLCLAAVIL